MSWLFHQFGFCPAGSTQEALLTVTQFWHNAMEAGGSAMSVFLDLAKAFDSNSHSRIIKALGDANVSGLKAQIDQLELEASIVPQTGMF